MKDILEKLIGKRSLAEVAASTGVSKATCSRLLNGNYKGRPSASLLWKLTVEDAEPQSTISFSEIMEAAGYSTAETQRYFRKFLEAKTKNCFSKREKAITEMLRSKLVSVLPVFTLEEVRDDRWPLLRINIPSGPINEWLFMFPTGWEYGEVDLERIIGFCTLQPANRERKITLVLQGIDTKQYALKTSYLGNLSVLNVSEQNNIVEETYLAAYSDEQVLL